MSRRAKNLGDGDDMVFVEGTVKSSPSGKAWFIDTGEEKARSVPKSLSYEAEGGLMVEEWFAHKEGLI